MVDDNKFRMELENTVFPVVSEDGKNKTRVLNEADFGNSVWELTKKYIENLVDNTDEAEEEFNKAKDKLYKHYHDLIKYAEKANESLDKVRSSSLFEFGRIFIEAYKELFYKIAAAYKEHKVKKGIENLVDRINGDTWSQKLAERLSKAKLQVGKAMNDLSAKAKKLGKNLRGVHHHGAAAPHVSGGADLENQGPNSPQGPHYVLVEGEPPKHPIAFPEAQTPTRTSARPAGAARGSGKWGGPLATVNRKKPGGGRGQ